MKRILISLAALGAFAVQASAVLDLTFTTPADKTFTLGIGQTGTLVGAVNGVTTDLSYFAFAPTTGFSFTIDPLFNTYLTGNNPNLNYSGNIGTITATGPAGTYNTVGTVAVSSSTLNTPGQYDGENLTVNVTPEPASLAALGVGAVALLRRRRKA